MSETTHSTPSKNISLRVLLKQQQYNLNIDSDCLTEDFIRDITGHYKYIHPPTTQQQIEKIRDRISRYWSDPENRLRASRCWLS